MSLRILNACIPFLYVKNIRYYKGKQILSYILNEFLPLLIYCILFFDKFDFLTFIVVWFFFWSFYEIGYLYNDVVSEKKEDKPSNRDGIDKSIFAHFKLILTIRYIICAALLFLIFSKSIVDVSLLLLLTVFTVIIFVLHNSLKDYRFRLTTLIMLAVLRTIYIPYVIFSEIDALIIIFLPSLIVKASNYVYLKHDSDWDFSHDYWPRFMLFIVWFLFLLFFGINYYYCLTFFPILLLQIFALIRHKKLEVNLFKHPSKR